ncbi:hypothetical protein KKJ01_14330 [Xenorhabdus bovienii]|uniref:Phage tail protein C-terminal domain-containing protein n=1 Tax=Xenorhabdus bovienii TaxID=40576 RepID=A0AAJ1J9E9_XENBV|nr:hypothetical protein [Xenorhabdus bovienii]MDE1479376.1 hypothetical protein [Xenorhabdus bovienii]
MIYSDGTTNIVSGSTIVRGTGTKWKSNINGIAAGQIISIQSGNTVIQNVIQSVNSDRELVLAFAPSISLNNANYVISTTVPDTVSDGVRHICAINAYIIQFLQNMDRWMSENGKVEVDMPNGQKVTLDSIRALQAAVGGKLVKEQNGADIPNKPEFVKNLGLAGAYTPQNKPSAHDIGAIQTNGGIIVGGTPNSNIKSFSDIPTNSTFFNYPGAIDGINVYGTGIKIGGSFSGYDLVLQSAYNGWSSGLYYRVRNGDTKEWRPFRMLYDEANTTFDGNGFIKKASPIIQIYPDGTFTTNDESEGATVTKLGLGHYKISGILGYNSDGAWGVHGGISVPRDVNGNELVYVDDKVLPDGAIEIKVTHRQNAHMPARLQNRRMKSVDEQTHYTDDEPCDLPAGTRLDVRVQMPEDSIWNQQHKSADTAPDVKWPEQTK